MCNLNEIEVSDDPIKQWAATREFELRHRLYLCPDPEQGYIELMKEAYALSDPKHPDYHSIHADIWNAREGK